LLLEITNTSNQPVERGSFTFKPGEVRVVELDPKKGTSFKELDGAAALRVTDLGAGEMQPLENTGESNEDRAERLKKERNEARAEADNQRRALDKASETIASAEDGDDLERRNAALRGEDINEVTLQAPAVKAKAEDQRYKLWAAEIREQEAERDYHLALVPIHAERDRQADQRVKDAESAKKQADDELHSAKVAAGKLGYEASREDNLARSAAGKIAQLKRQNGKG